MPPAMNIAAMTPSDQAITAARPRRKYASEVMTTRRRRILQEARALLAEGGETNLTINKLCVQSDVAPRTIYRAFGDKEGVILAAVSEHMHSIEEFLSVAPPVGDIQSIFSEYDWIVAELFRGPEFARAVIGLYFSPTPMEGALESLRSVAYNRVNAWLGHAERKGWLIAGLDRERIARYQVDTEYVVFHKWSVGQVPRERMADEMKANFLLTAIAAVTEPERSRLEKMLVTLHDKLRA